MENESNLLEKVSNTSNKKNLISNSLFNISVDLPKIHKTTIEAENALKMKELDLVSNTVCEEIIHNFDIEMNKIISNDPELKKINELTFYEFNEHKRFCNFCLVKKVI